MLSLGGRTGDAGSPPSEYAPVIGGRRITNSRYADDTTLLASTQERIRNFFKNLVQERAHYNMYINAHKSKTDYGQQTRQYFTASGPRSTITGARARL